jgi:ribosomal protein S27AE
MNQYSYRFEKSPKKKGKCPKCGQANTFRYYEEGGKPS